MGGSSPHTRGAPSLLSPSGPGGRIIPAYAGSTFWMLGFVLVVGDHPRIRGEHGVAGGGLDDGDGSSPHTRGALVQGLKGIDRDGIIPAYAGSTDEIPLGPSNAPDHPRIRGEHVTDLSGRSRRWGSSPHTRGAPSRPARFHVKPRIIPAYAGSTWLRRRPYVVHSDHPRIRGEHLSCIRYLSACSGSSPHTRGARSLFEDLEQYARIIPAYAGSTSSYPTCELPRTDHPRIRGEHAKMRGFLVLARGSSPHTRGARELGLRVPGVRGIIPAYAGSTRPGGGFACCQGDHPRIRGEHPRKAIVCPSKEGSSPHTRGALYTIKTNGGESRIIPAYAGSTKISQKGKGMAADHPRIRGEHHLGASTCTSESGSSPHTRGARPPAPCGRPGRRIIPAYAGSTRAFLV